MVKNKASLGTLRMLMFNDKIMHK